LHAQCAVPEKAAMAKDSRWASAKIRRDKSLHCRLRGLTAVNDSQQLGFIRRQDGLVRGLNTHIGGEPHPLRLMIRR
jgi:hypothetical protein